MKENIYYLHSENYHKNGLSFLHCRNSSIPISFVYLNEKEVFEKCEFILYWEK